MEQGSSGGDLAGAGEHGGGPEDHDSSEDYAATGDGAHGVHNRGNGLIPSSSSNNDEPFEENRAPAVNGSSVAGENRHHPLRNGAAANVHGPPLSSGPSNADFAGEPPNQAPRGNGVGDNGHVAPLFSGTSNADSAGERHRAPGPRVRPVPAADGIVANSNSDREQPEAPPANGAAVVDDDEDDVIVDITGYVDIAAIVLGLRQAAGVSTGSSGSSSQGTSSQSATDSSETSSSGDGTSSSGANTTSSDGEAVKMEDLDAQPQVPSSSDVADTSTSSGDNAPTF